MAVNGDGKHRKQVNARDVIDLIIAVMPVAVVLGIQYRDDIKRLQMRAQMYMERDTRREAEALKQVQREISWMEHGAPDAD
jgi:hypothetical protein